MINNFQSFKRHSYIAGYARRKRKYPPMFQGNKKRKKYFEGWYFKMVSADGSSILSVIPGISLSNDGKEQHAFIQIIDGKTANTFYYDFPIEDFSFSKEKFAVQIGKNYFSEEILILDIQNETTSIKGEIQMSDHVYLTQNKKRVGIMGWYKHVPLMQCYHGVVSLNHNLKGAITKDNEKFNFENGVGYIEKDWGKSMPSSWIWIQSNNFDTEKTSFMLSVAHIPWLGSSFTGFLGFFLNKGNVQRFGTYTNAKIQIKSSSPENIKIKITDKTYSYHIETFRSKSGLLKAPVKGSMDRRIAESVDAKLKLTVLDEKGNVIFKGSSYIAGLEIVGNMEELGMINKKKESNYNYKKEWMVQI